MRLLLLLPLLAAAACAGPGDALATGPDARPSARRVAALADSLASATTTTPRRAVVERALRRAGVTPLQDGVGPSSYQVDLGVPIVGGFVPGHHPVGRTDLVVVGMPLDAPGAAALLEAAHVIVERSLWTNRPERSVQFAFWPAGAEVGQVLRTSFWSRDAIRAVVVVGGDEPFEVGGIPVVRLGAEADALVLADALVARITAEARHVPRADTLASR